MNISGDTTHHAARSPSDHSTHSPQSTSAETRCDARIGLLGRAVIIPCAARFGRKPASVAVRDLSAVGVGVLHTQRLDSGEQFILRVPGKTPATSTALLCTVVHCSPLGPMGFALGARFISRLDAGNKNASPRLDSGSIESMTRSFCQQAVTGLSDQEAEQVRELEHRLSKLAV